MYLLIYIIFNGTYISTGHHYEINIVITIVGFAVIEGPPVVVFQPNEGPVELICNISGALTAWRVNDSAAIIPFEISAYFSGHAVNGANLLIVNATNNTEYVCVSVEGGGVVTDSDPVVLYIAGSYVESLSYV